MKVAIIVNELNIKGGTHKQVLRLCQYLKRHNVDFTIITRCFDLKKTYGEFGEFDIRYLYETMPKWYFVTSLSSKFLRFIKNKKSNEQLYKLIPNDCNIINIHDNNLDELIMHAKKDKKKVVWQINDVPHQFNLGTSSNAPDSISKKIKRWLTCLNVKDVDIITVNVTKNAERVKECFNKYAKVLYCGVDVNGSLNKHSYRKHDNVFRLLSMGFFFPYRNYETLVDVVKKLKTNNINIELNLVGNTEWDKEYANKISSIVSSYNLNDSIKIWGQVDDEIYTKLFNEADAFAFINIEQSWGLAVFEAMSAGLPTIVSNSVGAIELLHHDQDAIIVDPKNVVEICGVIQKLIVDKDYYNKISDEAYRVVKEFTWDKLYSSKMLELFDELEKK